MNSTVGPIFNEKVVEKWYLWVTCTIHEKHKTDKSDGKKKKKTQTWDSLLSKHPLY